MDNKLDVCFKSVSENELLARSIVSAFLLPYNPSVVELTDIKTAVSEAVTNCVVHGYPENVGEICMSLEISGNNLRIIVSDSGVGIEDVESALQPFFTTKPDDERSGMGFTIIQTFMDSVSVRSKLNEGTVVDMVKYLSL